MRNRSWWWYLALLVMVVTASLVVERGVGLVILLVSFMAGGPVYRSAKASGQSWRPLAYGLLLAVALGLVYYVADRLVFPHSPRAAERLHDACFSGLFYSLAGFFVEWNRNYKGLPMLNDPPAGSPPRRPNP